MDTSDLLTVLHFIGDLKETPRGGWVHRDIPDCESVAEHSYRTAMLAVLFTPDELDREWCITMALVHDLAEAQVGDLTPHDENEDMESLEAEVFAELGVTEFEEAWQEYRKRETDEARFVKELSEFEMVLQASEYAQEYDRDYSEFWEHADAYITTEPLRSLFEDLSPS